MFHSYVQKWSAKFNVFFYFLQVESNKPGWNSNFRKTGVETSTSLMAPTAATAARATTVKKTEKKPGDVETKTPKAASRLTTTTKTTPKPLANGSASKIPGRTGPTRPVSAKTPTSAKKTPSPVKKVEEPVAEQVTEQAAMNGTNGVEDHSDMTNGNGIPEMVAAN